MKKFFKPYKHLTSLALVGLFAFALIMLGAPVVIGFAVVALWQLSQFAMSKRCGMAFTTVLTPEQIKEFEGAVGRCSKFFDDNKSNFDGLKELGLVEGGFTAIKKLPELLKGEQKRVDELQGEVGKLRKQLALRSGPSGVKWVGQVPFVSDDCAKAITGVFVLECAKLGEGAMRSLRKDDSAHEGLVRHAGEVLGMEIKGTGFGQMRTALSGTEIPLPTLYVPQIVELVFAFGQARQFCTVYPMGAGEVKLPRLAAGEDEFGYLGVGTAGMSQAILEKRATAELITFAANKAGGLIRIPSELEQDTFIQLGQFLARYIARQLAKLEDRTLFIGDGTATYANQVGLGKYCVDNNTYLLKLDAGKTLVTDITLENIRDLRGKVSAAVLANMAANGQTAAAYYCHPSMEPMLRKLNKYPNFIVFEYVNGKPMLDGWPVRWIGVGAVNNGAAQAEAYALFFGDLSYWYMGERGSVMVDVSKEVFFATDELALRALERIDINAMAIDAVATLQLGAAA
jgi:HK97 family phage major capsid protein